MSIVEIPSPIDLRLMTEAIEWEKKAMDRPYRDEFFEAITKELGKQGRSQLKILELGSGPGFLADYIMTKLPLVKMTLLDFSSAMHSLAKRRLAVHLDRVVSFP